MRINKYIARSGITSRRKADELVSQGRVRVNGRKVTEPGTEVFDEDVVTVDGRVVKPACDFIYLALNKPVGYLTSASDDRGRPTVMDLLTDVDERVFHIGRLDYDTSGLLLLTNDGDLAQRISHPSHELDKTYIAKISGYLSPGKLDRLRKGVDIGGYVTRPAKVEVIKEGKNDIIEVTIHEGKNRQVRKMFEAVGTEVLELKRVSIGEIRLGHTKEGQYRKLTGHEIDYLKSI